MSTFEAVKSIGYLKVGMPCKYVGHTGRPHGCLGEILEINRKERYVVIVWRLANGNIEQSYSLRSMFPYIWDNVLFNLTYNKQKETEMQTVNLLTVGTGEVSISIEITPYQASLFETTPEGEALRIARIASVTKAIKQDGQYFALNPLKVHVPKVSDGTSAYRSGT